MELRPEFEVSNFRQTSGRKTKKKKKKKKEASGAVAAVNLKIEAIWEEEETEFGDVNETLDLNFLK